MKLTRLNLKRLIKEELEKLDFIKKTEKRWDLIYSREISLSGEIEYSNLTTNRPNKFYHYIYSRSHN